MVCTNIAQMLSLKPSTAHPWIDVLGYDYPGDWGSAKPFRYVPGETDTNQPNWAVEGGAMVYEGGAFEVGLFGAKMGLVDSTTSISNAMVAAMRRGVPLFFRNGIYVSDYIELTITNVLNIDGLYSSVFFKTNSYAWNFRNDQTAFAAVAVTNLATNAVNLHTDEVGTDLTLVATATLDTAVTAFRGDVLWIYSNDRIPGGHSYSATSAGRLGERLVVGLDAIATNVIHFTQIPLEDYRTAIRITKPNQLARLSMRDFIFAEHPSNPITQRRSGMVTLTGCLQPEVRNLVFNVAYGGALVMRSCYQGTVANISGRLLRNVAADAQYGYLVSDIGCQGIVYRSLQAHTFRHPFTTISSPVEDGDTTLPWFYHGASIGFIVEGLIAEGGENAGVDFHENSLYGTYRDFVVSGNYDGNNSGGTGITLRGRYSTAEQGKVINCNIGLLFWDGYGNAVQHPTVRNVQFYNSTEASINAYSSDASGGRFINDALIEDCYFSQRGSTNNPATFASVFFSGMTNFLVRRTTFDIEANRNGAVQIRPATTNAPAANGRFEDCTWIITPHDYRPFYLRSGDVVFERNNFTIRQANNPVIDWFRMEDFGATPTKAWFNDCLFEPVGVTNSPSTFSLLSPGAQLFGRNVVIDAKGDGEAIGWLINADTAIAPRVVLTNWYVNAAINGGDAGIDPLFIRSNMFMDVTTPMGSGRYVNSGTETALKWPVRFVLFGNAPNGISTNVAPDATMYLPGDQIEFLHTSTSTNRWGLIAAPGQTVEGSSTIPMWFTKPGDRLQLVTDGKTWRSAGIRTREFRQTAANEVWLSSADGYAVDAGASTRVITLPQVANAGYSDLINGIKIDPSANSVHFVPPAGVTLNGLTNAVILSNRWQAATFRRFWGGAPWGTNWLITGMSPGVPIP